MIKKCIIFIFAFVAIVACSDDDTFTASRSNVLTFENDTLSFDTCFSAVPTSHRTFKVYNNSGDGIRISNVRLESGNQRGYRVNVHGSALGPSNGYQVNDLELDKGAFMRVFVELTSKLNGDTLPKLVDDNLIFTLESGVQQRVNLKAYSWDATLLKDYHVTGDSVTHLSNSHGKPIIVYGNIDIDTVSTLKVMPGTTIYFHSGAGINVNGRLLLCGEKDKEITLRSDRFDWMVSNLAYDNNPGQWGGIYINSCSYDNEVHYTDLHAGSTAFLCDSSYDSSRKTLTVTHSTIHNLKGYGIKATNANILLENTQISNTQQHCLSFVGGNVSMNGCSVLQYYPFDAKRGMALYFANGQDGESYPLTLDVKNTLIKGYADDVITWSYGGTEDSLQTMFDHCLVKTVAGDKFQYMFKDCIMENDAEDTLALPRNSFLLFDTKNFYYNFAPLKGSRVISAANPLTSLPNDRNGVPRTSLPTIGCHEFIDKSEE